MTTHQLKSLINDKQLLTELAQQFGTPLYVYSHSRLQNNLDRLNNALNQNFDKYHICYAIKANSNPNLIKQMKNHLPKIGGDCASPGEIETARRAGIASENCIYTGNYESLADLEYALDAGININLDDISSLERLNRIRLPKRISFRLNPGFGKGMFNQINTGGKTAKFGVRRRDILSAYQRAYDLGIRRFGIQSMTGSGVLDKDYFPKLLSAILTTTAEIESNLNIRMEYISIGGGIGIPYQDEIEPMPLDYIMRELSQVFYKYYDRTAVDCPALWLEPGKYIIGDAGFILASVTGIKKSYRKFIGLDAGMETILRPALYQAYHRILKVGASDETPVGTFEFTGRICENTDLQATDRPFPAVGEGDLVAIMDAGAYGYALSQPYNSRPRPAEVILSENGAKLIRKRETIDDLFSSCQL